jgi:hypothetical protein
MAGTAAAQRDLPSESAEQAFRGGRTGDLAKLCAARLSDPNGAVQRAWCHGFLVATAQYHASASGERGAHRPIYCLPDPAPTLDQAREGFVRWVEAHPAEANTRAIDGLMHYAAETYPCPQREAPRMRR